MRGKALLAIACMIGSAGCVGFATGSLWAATGAYLGLWAVVIAVEIGPVP